MSLDQPVVLRAAERYVAAGRRFEENPTIASADAVIIARLALQQVFMDAGWLPSQARQEEMQRDWLIVQHCVGIDDYVERQMLSRVRDAAGARTASVG